MKLINICRKGAGIGLLLTCLTLGLLAPKQSGAQAAEAEQLLLNVEKLAQLKSMLQDLKKGYALLQEGYGAVRDISEGNFSLHENFLNRLLQVSPAVRTYFRVGDIVRTQGRLLSEGRSALRQLAGSGQLSAAELAYAEGVYRRLLQKSTRSLEELILVLTSGALRMSDGERLAAIDALWRTTEEQLGALHRFTSGARLMALARARERSDITAMRKLYSLHP